VREFVSSESGPQIDRGARQANVAACTVVSKKRLSHARAWSKSFRCHHPTVPVFVLLADRLDGLFDPRLEPFQVLSPEDLGIPDLARMRFAFGVHAFTTATKPFLLLHLIERLGFHRAIYFDSDVHMYAPVSRGLELLEEADAVLVPHLMTPLPKDDRQPKDSDFLTAGAYNAGFVAVRGTEDGRAFLRWWASHLATECEDFRDQVWLGLAPALFSGIRVLRDRAYNAAYWNLHERRDLDRRDGVFLLGEAPLVFFHFSGLDPAHPDAISRHQDRYVLGELAPAYRELFEEYVASLRAEGLEQTASWPYSFDRFDDGVRIPDVARGIYRRESTGASGWEKPFARSGGFRDWLLAPGSMGPWVPRWLETIYRNRIDLKFASPNGDGAADLLRWAISNSGAEYGLDDYFLSDLGRRLAELETAALSGRSPGPSSLTGS
jgi:hypothetical protein